MFVDNLTNIPDDQFIIPMRLDPDFKDRLLIRRVQVDADNPYIGRDGQKHDHPYLDLANKLAVRGYPTCCSLPPMGRALPRSKAPPSIITTTISTKISIWPPTARRTQDRNSATVVPMGQDCRIGPADADGVNVIIGMRDFHMATKTVGPLPHQARQDARCQLRTAAGE